MRRPVRYFVKPSNVMPSQLRPTSGWVLCCVIWGNCAKPSACGERLRPLRHTIREFAPVPREHEKSRAIKQFYRQPRLYRKVARLRALASFDEV